MLLATAWSLKTGKRQPKLTTEDGSMRAPLRPLIIPTPARAHNRRRRRPHLGWGRGAVPGAGAKLAATTPARSPSFTHAEPGVAHFWTEVIAGLGGIATGRGRESPLAESPIATFDTAHVSPLVLLEDHRC